MDLRVQQASVTEIDTPLLVVNLFEGVTQPGGATGAVDAALGGQISRLIADGEITGEPATRHGHPQQRPATASRRSASPSSAWASRPSSKLENVRVAAALAARKARDLKLDSFATIVHGAGQRRAVARRRRAGDDGELDPGAVSLRAVQGSHEVAATRSAPAPSSSRTPSARAQLEQTAELARIDLRRGDEGARPVGRARATSSRRPIWPSRRATSPTRTAWTSSSGARTSCARTA